MKEDVWPIFRNTRQEYFVQNVKHFIDERSHSGGHLQLYSNFLVPFTPDKMSFFKITCSLTVLDTQVADDFPLRAARRSEAVSSGGVGTQPIRSGLGGRLREPHPQLSYPRTTSDL
ncbi:hypothetical protein NPIL_564301 [Nephila pilipes]|uniref:Uncharacterized protein n=1 Tax=Nephila pilipes TaxID=299642 RepID=A0A8X6U501_NEPPI|nr:hypothetical protein NPIL_564301 [Nephila pilipes]